MCGERKLTQTSAEFIDKLLILDPNGRFSADDALDHDYFWTEPHPLDKEWCVLLFWMGEREREREREK